jgi:hypothetical protein
MDDLPNVEMGRDMQRGMVGQEKVLRCQRNGREVRRKEGFEKCKEGRESWGGKGELAQSLKRHAPGKCGKLKSW